MMLSNQDRSRMWHWATARDPETKKAHFIQNSDGKWYRPGDSHTAYTDEQVYAEWEAAKRRKRWIKTYPVPAPKEKKSVPSRRRAHADGFVEKDWAPPRWISRDDRRAINKATARYAQRYGTDCAAAYKTGHGKRLGKREYKYEYTNDDGTSAKYAWVPWTSPDAPTQDSKHVDGLVYQPGSLDPNGVPGYKKGVWILESYCARGTIYYDRDGDKDNWRYVSRSWGNRADLAEVPFPICLQVHPSLVLHYGLRSPRALFACVRDIYYDNPNLVRWAGRPTMQSGREADVAASEQREDIIGDILRGYRPEAMSWFERVFIAMTVDHETIQDYSQGDPDLVNLSLLFSAAFALLDPGDPHGSSLHGVAPVVRFRVTKHPARSGWARLGGSIGDARTLANKGILTRSFVRRTQYLMATEVGTGEGVTHRVEWEPNNLKEGRVLGIGYPHKQRMPDGRWQDDLAVQNISGKLKESWNKLHAGEFRVVVHGTESSGTFVFFGENGKRYELAPEALAVAMVTLGKFDGKSDVRVYSCNSGTNTAQIKRLHDALRELLPEFSGNVWAPTTHISVDKKNAPGDGRHFYADDFGVHPTFDRKGEWVNHNGVLESQ